jgi:hypothetical protein
MDRGQNLSGLVLFQILLFATDRKLDRDRGDERSAIVTLIMKGVSFDLAKEALPSFCFELLQNVPLSEQQQFRLVVDALAVKNGMTPSLKAINLGLMLMNVVGREVLKTSVERLGVQIQGARGLSADIVKLLALVDFNKAYPTLISVCFVISEQGEVSVDGKPSTPVTRRQAVEADLNDVIKNPELKNATKVLLLALALQQQVGDDVLLNALKQLGPALKLDNLTVPGGSV